MDKGFDLDMMSTFYKRPPLLSNEKSRTVAGTALHEHERHSTRHGRCNCQAWFPYKSNDLSVSGQNTLSGF